MARKTWSPRPIWLGCVAADRPLAAGQMPTIAAEQDPALAGRRGRGYRIGGQIDRARVNARVGPVIKRLLADRPSTDRSGRLRWHMRGSRIWASWRRTRDGTGWPTSLLHESSIHRRRSFKAIRDPGIFEDADPSPPGDGQRA